MSLVPSPLTPLFPLPVTQSYHPDLYDLVDLDASRPQWTQYPCVTVEIRSPGADTPALLYTHVLRRNVDALLRQNSFSQRSATVDLTLHDVPDLNHLTSRKPVQCMSRLYIHEGYAGQTVQTFAGYITKASYSNTPRELRITATDALYLAREFFILTPLDYQGWTAEDAVRDLLTRCGISTNYVNIGGYNPVSMTYDQSFHAPPLPVDDSTTAKNGAVVGYQNAETALQHICDLYGFRFWCDVHGMVEFQYIRPMPQDSPSVVPAIPGVSGFQYALRFMGALAAQERYLDPTLPGNLIHVVDHSSSSDELRNFVGVYDGRTAPLYLSRPPALPGFPAPRSYTPTGPVVDKNGNPTTRQSNTARLPYWTSAQVVASDQIVATATVFARPNTTDTTTTDMAHFLANRMLDDLNRPSDTEEIVTIGCPFLDLGQTVYVKDPDSNLDGNYFVTGYQTRMSAGGYTSQIKLAGGPVWHGQGARPRPHFRTFKRHDNYHQVHGSLMHGHTMTGTAAGAYSMTPRPGPGSG